MTRNEALETGRIRMGETVSGCTGFYLAMYGDASGLGPHGYFSEDGLAVIHAQGGMHTPEGVALGTPVEEVQRTYPAIRRSDGLLTVAASDQADYFFVMHDDAVRYFGLSSSDDPASQRLWLTPDALSCRVEGGYARPTMPLSVQPCGRADVQTEPVARWRDGSFA